MKYLTDPFWWLLVVLPISLICLSTGLLFATIILIAFYGG